MLIGLDKARRHLEILLLFYIGLDQQIVMNFITLHLDSFQFMTKTTTFKYTKEKSQPKITVYEQGCGMLPTNLDQGDMTAR
jgi:hypothetical protein